MRFKTIQQASLYLSAEGKPISLLKLSNYTAVSNFFSAIYLPYTQLSPLGQPAEEMKPKKIDASILADFQMRLFGQSLRVSEHHTSEDSIRYKYQIVSKGAIIIG